MPAGGWPVEEREDTETCCILSGRAIITDGATGETFEISAGDVSGRTSPRAGPAAGTSRRRSASCTASACDAVTHQAASSHWSRRASAGTSSGSPAGLRVDCSVQITLPRAL
ncbi:cupin domain-containing protein [Streptomyces sp. NPDC093598]|uniref:cupin domain-containing protein n=1 Tax=Streptomyces sp. NPDC093598 TaxID=3366046 RepID=UPI00381DBC35